MLKLGLIGLSEGNGHPYSWGAIMNGYDRIAMQECGFPVIPEYLGRHALPEESISSAKVTHVWTQDRALTQKVARATYIENICDSLGQLSENVDAILLARDDWQSHVELGLPLLKTGKPMYIDKPLAVDMVNLKKLLDAQVYPGQIFSCSALRYSHQLRLTESQKQELGTIRFINSTVSKSWEKYAIHIIDPVVGLFADNDEIESIRHTRRGDIEESQVVWESGLISNFSTFGELPAIIQFTLVGEKGTKSLIWDDAFSAFKATLEVFIHRAISGNPVVEDHHHKKVVRILESGVI